MKVTGLKITFPNPYKRDPMERHFADNNKLAIPASNEAPCLEGQPSLASLVKENAANIPKSTLKGWSQVTTDLEIFFKSLDNTAGFNSLEDLKKHNLNANDMCHLLALFVKGWRQRGADKYYKDTTVGTRFSNLVTVWLQTFNCNLNDKALYGALYRMKDDMIN